MSGKDDVSFNGRSREVYERIKAMEVKQDYACDHLHEMKQDVKDIRAAMLPLIEQVYFHDKLLKIGGSALSAAVAIITTLAATGVL